MKLPVFYPAEIESLLQALARSESTFYKSQEELINKLNMYKSISEENNTLTTILNAVLQDSQLTENPSGKGLPPESMCKYSLNIEANADRDAYYFSVYNESLEIVLSQTTPSGLFGVIEIRDGKPSISLGLTPDMDDLQVVSNNSTTLSVIPEEAVEKPTWQTVPINGHNYNGLVFTFDDNTYLNEQRKALADNIFSHYDFEQYVVADDGSWSINANTWVKTVYFENGQLPSIASDFSLTFASNSAQVLDTTYALR